MIMRAGSRGLWAPNFYFKMNNCQNGATKQVIVQDSGTMLFAIMQCKALCLSRT